MVHLPGPLHRGCLCGKLDSSRAGLTPLPHGAAFGNGAYLCQQCNGTTIVDSSFTNNQGPHAPVAGRTNLSVSTYNIGNGLPNMHANW